MVYNNDSKIINSAYATVSIKGGTSDGSGSGDYAGSKVYFTNDVSDDGTIGPEGTSYNINKDKGSYVYCVVDNYPNQLNTEEMVVDIYKKNGSSEYKFVDG